MTIDQAKAAVTSLKGKNVKVTVSKGRNRTEKFCGTVSDIFPAVFTMTVFGADKTASYSYSDIICGTVRFSPATE